MALKGMEPDPNPQ